MIVHLTTNFSCNKNCEYCYLGSLKNDPTYISSSVAYEKLFELSNRYDIERIDCYGGEITLLPLDHIIDLFNVCKTFTSDVTWVTNLSDPKKCEEIYRLSKCEYATSLNDERGDDHILEKMSIMEFPPKNLIQVATPSLLAKSPKEILGYASLFNINYLGFVQYFPSIVNELDYSSKTPNRDYSDFLINVFEEYFNGNYKFKLENLSDIDLIRQNKYLPWMDASLFILPNGEYASVVYNPKDNGREHFHIWNNLDEFDELVRWEKTYYTSKPQCKSCKYLGHCYAEHLREWDIDDDCCGNYRVLEYLEKVGY